MSVAQKQIIQATLTDEEAAGCARKLTKIETLQARIDGAICASYEGRVFQNRYACADGSERRQFEVIEVRGRHGVTETSGVRCVCCSTDDKPFTWPKMKLDALLRNLRHHAGHTTQRAVWNQISDGPRQKSNSPVDSHTGDEEARRTCELFSWIRASRSRGSYRRSRIRASDRAGAGPCRAPFPRKGREKIPMRSYAM